MGCSCAECTIYIFSFLSIAGLGVMGVSFFLAGSNLQSNQYFIDNNIENYPYYSGLLLLGLMALFIITGLILMITKNKCIATCYSCCLFIPFIVMFILSIGLLWLNNRLPSYIADSCDNNYEAIN
jgi:hypothetical protein